MKIKKLRTNVTIDPKLNELCKQYKINISQAINEALTAKLLKVTPYLKQEEAKSKYSTCMLCKQNVGIEKIRAVAYSFDSCHADEFICIDCLQKTYKDTKMTYEEKIMSDTWCLVAASKLIKNNVAIRLRQRDD